MELQSNPEFMDKSSIEQQKEDEDEINKRLGITDEFIGKFGRIKCVLVDLSGTLHIGDTQTRSAVNALQELRDLGLNVRFVTNTTKESKRRLLERLLRIGFNILPEEIYTSLTEARGLVDKMNLRPYLLIDEDAMEEFEGMDESPSPNAVVIGLAPRELNYDRLNTALKILLNGGTLIGIHKGRYYRDENQSLALGPGPFVTALEYASNCQAIIVGKPESLLFKNAVGSTGCALEDAVMIGDDLRDDVQAAMNLGMKGILVKTGKYRPGDELKILPNVPDYIASDFALAVQSLKSAVSAFQLVSGSS